jgi:hypothetical protein
VDHTNHYEQAAKGLRHAKRHVCQNCLMMFVENTTNTNTISARNERKTKSPYFDYIVVAMSDSLDDQTTHAKVFSSHHYEQQKLMEKMMTQSCQICTTW